MSGWNPRRAFRQRPNDVLHGGLAALALAAVLGVTAVPPVMAATLVVVNLAHSPVDCPACASYLQADAAWLRQQPGSTRRFRDLPGWSGGASDSLALNRDQLVVLKQQLGDGLSAADIGTRPLTALVRDRWLGRGYLQADVRLAAGVADRPDTLVVDPGPVWTLAEIDLAGDDFPGRQAVLDHWLPGAGARFSAPDLTDAMEGMLEEMGERGYPFPHWVTRDITLDPDDHTVTIAATLLPGRRSWIGPITSDLHDDNGAGFLVRTTGLHAGQMFASSRLDQAVTRLEARGLYARVDKPRVYVTPSPDTVGIYFPVVPRRKVNRMQAVLGLSRAGSTGGSRLSGQVDLELPNMAGTGRSLQAGWRDDGAGSSRFGFSFREPLVLGSPLDLTFATSSDVRKDVFTRFHVEGKGELPVVALWGVGAGLGWDRATYPSGILQRTSRLLASGSILHKRGDQWRSGWQGMFEISSSWGSEQNRDPGSDAELPSRLGRSTSVRIYAVDLGGELLLSQNFSLAGRGSYREQSGRNQVVPMAEQFWFGGANTLRGYNEREFHGSTTAWGGLEFRIGKVGSSRLYTFWDLGYFQFYREMPGESSVMQRVSGHPRGYGLGLLAMTRGGDLSLAIGFPGTVDFDLAKLHVTLLESF